MSLDRIVGPPTKGERILASLLHGLAEWMTRRIGIAVAAGGVRPRARIHDTTDAYLFSPIAAWQRTTAQAHLSWHFS